MGKSCVLLQYTDQRFKLAHDLTIGVEFGTKIAMHDKTSVKLQIWDTAGSESFRSLTKGYYKGSAGAIVVYDVTNRQSFASVESWIEEIQQCTSGQTVIFLVANKCDLVEEYGLILKRGSRKVSKEEGEGLAKRKGMKFFEVSAKTGENVDLCFTEMTHDICQKIALGEIDVTNEATGVKVLKSKSGEKGPADGCSC